MSFLELLAYGAIIAGLSITIGFAAGRARGIEVERSRQRLVKRLESKARLNEEYGRVRLEKALALLLGAAEAPDKE